MKKSFLEYVKTNSPVLFDGAMGSLLIDSGLGPNEIPESWNIVKEELIRSIHMAYSDAGANVLTTNTFGGSVIKLKSKNLDKQIAEINAVAVKIAKKACPEECYIAGDIGPTGKFLPPVGNYSENDFYNSFLNQAQVLIASGVDLIIIETMYDLREASQAINAVRNISSGIPVIVTMTFEKRKRGFFTIMGDTPEKSFSLLEELGANIVGMNCTLNSKGMIELINKSRKFTNLPLICQPNAGQPEVVGDKVTYPQSPKDYADDIMEIINLGANIVGGCCGTNPEFIREIAKRIEK